MKVAIQYESWLSFQSKKGGVCMGVKINSQSSMSPGFLFSRTIRRGGKQG